MEQTKFIDNLHNEIAREKFLALRRISETLSGCLRTLQKMDGDIKKAVEENRSTQEINKLIETFNNIRNDAEEWLYYLNVTREASGFFSNTLGADAYKIPPQRRPIRTGENRGE